MANSLILNATYEPLSIVSTRRAVVLVLGERAEMVHATGRVVRSELLEIDEPSVVRLSRYVHVPRHRRRGFSRRAVLHRDEHRCQYCGSQAESVDHVVPRSRGGGRTWLPHAVAATPARVIGRLPNPGCGSVGSPGCPGSRPGS